MASFLTFSKVDDSVLSRGRRQGLPRFEAEVLDQRSFVRTLRLEQKRAERSNSRFGLMVIERAEGFQTPGRANTLANIVLAISNSTRETDTLGWYEQGTKLGVVFTEIAAADDTAMSKIVERMNHALRAAVGTKEFQSLKLMVAAFPANFADESLPRESDLVTQPDSDRNAAAGNASLQLRHAT